MGSKFVNIPQISIAIKCSSVMSHFIFFKCQWLNSNFQSAWQVFLGFVVFSILLLKDQNHILPQKRMKWKNALSEYCKNFVKFYWCALGNDANRQTDKPTAMEELLSIGVGNQTCWCLHYFGDKWYLRKHWNTKWTKECTFGYFFLTLARVPYDVDIIPN